MAYFAPYIDSTGVHLPTYEDRLQDLLSSYRTIFGQDVSLEISSPDYQLLSVFARSLDDLSALILSSFNARNPDYATGTALDLLLPLNGITRSTATCSTATLHLTGTANATLATAFQVRDDAGYLWQLASGIQLSSSGTADVTAICTTPGAISAPAGSICHLVTAVTGLTSATNQAAATPGADAETDAQARYRRSLAVSSPSVSPYEALLNALLAIPNIRACKLYVNDTDSTDENGIPAHAICAVMAGGNTTRIAQTLFAKKAPGIGTHGATSTTVTDSFGFAHTVKFQRATESATAISVTLTALSGFDTTTDPDKIKATIVSALAAQQIAQPLVVPSLYAACYGAVSSPCFTVTSITASPAGGSASSGTISATWNQRFVTYSNMVSITVN